MLNPILVHYFEGPLFQKFAIPLNPNHITYDCSEKQTFAITDWYRLIVAPSTNPNLKMLTIANFKVKTSHQSLLLSD